MLEATTALMILWLLVLSRALRPALASIRARNAK